MMRSYGRARTLALVVALLWVVLAAGIVLVAAVRHDREAGLQSAAHSSSPLPGKRAKPASETGVSDLLLFFVRPLCDEEHASAFVRREALLFEGSGIAFE